MHPTTDNTNKTIQTLKEEITKLTSTNEQITKKNELNDEKIQTLQEEHTKLRNTATSQQTEQTKQKQTNDQLTAENVMITEKLNSYNTRIEQQKTKIKTNAANTSELHNQHKTEIIRLKEEQANHYADLTTRLKNTHKSKENQLQQRIAEQQQKMVEQEDMLIQLQQEANNHTRQCIKHKMAENTNSLTVTVPDDTAPTAPKKLDNTITPKPNWNTSTTTSDITDSPPEELPQHQLEQLSKTGYTITDIDDTTLHIRLQANIHQNNWIRALHLKGNMESEDYMVKMVPMEDNIFLYAIKFNDNKKRTYIKARWTLIYTELTHPSLITTNSHQHNHLILNSYYIFKDGLL